MLKEYDIVQATRKLNNNVPENTIGTILIVYDSKNYEVEFVNPTGETLGVLTVSENDIQKQKSKTNPT